MNTTSDSLRSRSAKVVGGVLEFYGTFALLLGAAALIAISPILVPVVLLGASVTILGSIAKAILRTVWWVFSAIAVTLLALGSLSVFGLGLYCLTIIFG